MTTTCPTCQTTHDGPACPICAAFERIRAKARARRADFMAAHPDDAGASGVFLTMVPASRLRTWPVSPCPQFSMSFRRTKKFSRQKMKNKAEQADAVEELRRIRQLANDRQKRYLARKKDRLCREIMSRQTAILKKTQ
jgi:hypothetical protein